MPLPPCSLSPSNRTISYWKLGPQLTGGRWYEIYKAAPKMTSEVQSFGYVLKLINPALSSEKRSQAIERLGREVFATERIVHPNVIRLLDAEIDHAPFMLVQPWIEGRSLDRILSSLVHLPLSRILWISRQVAEGIRAGHEQNRVYLGLDPAHVMIGKTGRVTLLGWSQSHGEGELAPLPHDQLQLARYTAPECFDPGYQANRASDVYSLGVLIYHILTKRAPFDGITVEQIARGHRHTITEDLMFAQPLCPPRLSHLVKEMIVKNPLHRPSLTEVLNRLILIEIDHLNDQTLVAL